MAAARARFLVCDDDEVIVDLLQLLLGSLQCDMVGICDNGKDAVELFKATSPDVTLMDIKMPGMNGVEALHEILQFDPKAKVIMLSGISEAYITQSSASIGASGYIQKGGSPDALLADLREVLNTSGFTKKLKA